MKRRQLTSAALAALAAAAVTAGVAEGSSTSNTTSTQAHSASAGPMPGGPGGGPGGHAVHSVSVVLDKAGTAFITQTSDEGTVKSVDSSAGTVTVDEGTKSVSYKTVTLEVPSSATVTLDGKTSSLGALAAGDHVSVMSSSDGTTVFATDSSFKPEGGPGKGGPGGPMPPSGTSAPTAG